MHLVCYVYGFQTLYQIVFIQLPNCWLTIVLIYWFVQFNMRCCELHNSAQHQWQWYCQHLVITSQLRLSQ